MTLPLKLQTIDPPQSQFEVLFENVNDALLVVDLSHYKITRVNQATLELTGYLRQELEGKPFQTLFPKGNILPIYGKPLSEKHIQSSGFFEDTVLASKDGYLRFISLSVRTLKYRKSWLALCILRDIGEKKKMERELITKHTELRNAYIQLEKSNAEMKSMQETLVQSGKLAALGELAAGIAHELNQPLTAIKGFAQEAKVSCKEENPQTTLSHLKEVVEGADKMQKIISHLRNFTRKSTEDFHWVDIHSIIDESLLMLDKQLKSRGIQVEKSYSMNLPKVYCNPFQLEQVFINLSTNARDAIEANNENEGRIYIQTRQNLDGVVEGGNPSGVVEVVYQDNGCGIAESIKAKVFNPFFTTKEVGKGMGLGLSISYGILTRINASILVESTVGKGTVFTIRLPVDYRQH